MKKSRVPMQVSPEFNKKMKDLQRKIRKIDGDDISLRDLTERISKSEDFLKIESSILNNNSKDLRINLDRRKRR